MTSAINRLLQLEFLPKFKGFNATYEARDTREDADRFRAMEYALQEATFDCVIAISKISMHMRNAIFADNLVKYEKSAKAQKLRDDIRARKDY